MTRIEWTTLLEHNNKTEIEINEMITEIDIADEKGEPVAKNVSEHAPFSLSL